MNETLGYITNFTFLSLTPLNNEPCRCFVIYGRAVPSYNSWLILSFIQHPILSFRQCVKVYTRYAKHNRYSNYSSSYGKNTPWTCSVNLLRHMHCLWTYTMMVFIILYATKAFTVTLKVQFVKQTPLEGARSKQKQWRSLMTLWRSVECPSIRRDEK